MRLSWYLREQTWWKWVLRVKSWVKGGSPWRKIWSVERERKLWKKMAMETCSNPSWTLGKCYFFLFFCLWWVIWRIENLRILKCVSQGFQSLGKRNWWLKTCYTDFKMWIMHEIELENEEKSKRGGISWCVGLILW